MGGCTKVRKTPWIVEGNTALLLELTMGSSHQKCFEASMNIKRHINFYRSAGNKSSATAGYIFCCVTFIQYLVVEMKFLYNVLTDFKWT